MCISELKLEKILHRPLTAILLLIVGVFIGPYAAHAAMPQTIGYEGYVTNSGGTAQTGSQNVRVRVYDAASAGTLLFDETHASITFSTGYFSIAIGSGSYNGGSVVTLADLPFDQTYYLTIEITSLSTGEMSPRTPMNAVPYAYLANGLLAQAADPSANLNAGELYFNTGNSTIKVYDGLTWLSVSTSTVSAGSAVNNTLRWNGTAWVESGALTNDGTNVTSTGNFAVNGGTLSTSATTAALFNTAATTLNIGGAATAIGLGAADAVLTGGGAFTIRSGSATALVLDSGTTGALSLGTGANAKTITIGNITGATVLNLQSGTGGLNLQMAGTSTTANVQVGAGGAGSATPDLLVLDSKSTSGDPTGTNGALYYNTNTGKFRCYENSAWTNCITSAGSGADAQHAVIYDTDEAMTNIPTGGAQVTLGTVSVTPTGATGDVYVTGWADVYSNNGTDQPLQLAIETTSNCTGAIVGNASVTYTITTGASGVNDRGSLRVSGIVVDPGTSSQSYSLCAAVTSGAGNSNILNWGMEALVIDTGADLAEIYTTNDAQLQAGDVVSLDPHLKTGIKKSANAHDQTVLGVVSTRPGMVIGGVDKEGVQALPVALSGRVPVKVVTENGPIHPGDALSPSSVPGVAMKAVGGGPVIALAMSSYAGEDVGVVLAFVKSAVSHRDTLSLEKLTPQVNADGSDNGLTTLIATIRVETSRDPVAMIAAMIANGAHVIADVVTARLTAVRGYFDELFSKKIHAEQLCLRASDGTEACINGDEWRILQGQRPVPEQPSSAHSPDAALEPPFME